MSTPFTFTLPPYPTMKTPRYTQTPNGAVFEISANWIEFAHGPASEEGQPLAVAITEMPLNRKGQHQIPLTRVDLIAEIADVAGLYDTAEFSEDRSRAMLASRVIARCQRVLALAGTTIKAEVTKAHAAVEAKAEAARLAGMSLPKPNPRPPGDRGQGRKAIDPSGECMQSRQIRMTDAQWAKCLKLGGAAWIRDRINKARD